MPRTAVFHGPKRPFEYVDFPAPTPEAGEILVRVVCCTLCRSDLHTFSGRRTEPTPTVLGHEIVGHIEAFGPAAMRADARGTPAAVGDRVTWAITVGCGYCFFCTADLPQKCQHLRKYGHERVSLDRPVSGGLSECILLDSNTDWFLVPDAISDPVAALSSCATATTAAVLAAAGPVAGRTVVVFGAGLLGLSACAMLRARDAGCLIAVDPSEESRARAGDFGANEAASPEELAERVRQATDGRGADVLLELSGASDGVAAALANARIGGTVVLAGSVAPTAAIAIDPESIVRRMLTLRGVHNYHPRDLDAALAFLAGPGRDYPFDSLIAAEYPLDAAADAFLHAANAAGQRVAVRPR